MKKIQSMNNLTFIGLLLLVAIVFFVVQALCFWDEGFSDWIPVILFGFFFVVTVILRIAVWKGMLPDETDNEAK